MPDSQRYNDWYAKSQSEFDGAKILITYGGDYSLIAFLCQQAIEKVLKGYILKNSKVLIEGHSLIYLCKKSIEIDASFKEQLKNCTFVNQFYIETRYPADIPIGIDKEDADECLNIAAKILAKVFETENNGTKC